MRKIKLFIATSLDGFIAGEDDDISWLFTDGDYGYKEFYDSIDTTLSGYNTYSIALSFDNFPYPDKTNYVFSRLHQDSEDSPVKFISADPCLFADNLKAMAGKDIWLIGGGQLNTLLLDGGLIDELIISIHPIILGKGIPLFAGHPKRKTLHIKKSEAFASGLLQVTYEIKE